MPLAVLLLAAALAQADVPLPPPPPGTSLVPNGAALPPPPPPPEVAAEDEPSGGPPRLGLALEGGFPEGAMLGVVWRALPSVRLWGGPAWNYASFGVQGGATFQPWRFAVSPVVSVEAGRYFSADLTRLANDASGVPEELRPLMNDVRYAYGAAHLGLELGSPSGFAFSLKVGLAYVSLQARGTARSTGDAGTGGTATAEFDDPRIRGTLPSVKLGLQYWF
jgi:hypothetical protein